MAKAARRPNLGRVIKAVMRDAAARLPELSHIDARRILVVAGEARRASRATVKPLSFRDSKGRFSRDGKREKPIIRVRGRRMLYVISFRPMFFLDSSPEKRVATILHELWHVSPRFDGTLDETRRHGKLKAGEFNRTFLPLVRRYLKEIPDELLERLAFNGIGTMRMWLERPAPNIPVRAVPRRRVIFTEQQLFYGPVKMVTHARRRKRAAA